MDYIQQMSQWAQNGDVRASLLLGLAYLYGIAEVAPYSEEAKYWLSKAAEKDPAFFEKNWELQEFLND